MQNMSSAAVVIGALMVKYAVFNGEQEIYL